MEKIKAKWAAANGWQRFGVVAVVLFVGVAVTGGLAVN